jgi:ribosomal protein S18 acetylase RimI-like enzyme
VSFEVRPLGPSDRGWVAALAAERWGGEAVVSRGRVWMLPDLPGFAAVESERVVGLLTYRVEDAELEVVSIDSLTAGRGVGSALLEAAAAAARRHGCRRMWLITTNDNLRALRFYQRRGMRLAALHRDSLARARELKPSIPDTGYHGIPLRDELELELLLPAE